MAQSGEPKNRSTQGVNTVTNNERSKGVDKKVPSRKRRARLPVLGKAAKKSNGE
jgi:hypothetical protein